MRILQLRQRHVFAVDELEFEPKSINRFLGRNEAGKSSAIRALKLLFGGGTAEAILKRGESSGELVAVIEDGGDKLTVRRGITEKGLQPPTVNSEKFGPIKRVQEWLNTRIDAVSINPARFISASDKERAQWLFDIMPLSVSAEQLSAATGLTIREHEVEGNALDVIERYRSKFYTDRTQANTLTKDKRATAKVLREGLPKGDHKSASAELSNTQQKIGALDARLADLTATSDRELTARVDEFQKSQAAERDALNREAQELRRRLDAIDARFAAMRSDLDLYMAQEREASTTALQQTERAINEERAELTDRAATLTEQVAAFERGKRTAELIRQHEKDADEQERLSKAYSAILERLDALKGEIIDGCPIPGLTIEAGVPRLDGLPLENVSTGELWRRVIIPLAAMRAGDGGVVFLDCAMDALDAPNRAAFIEAAKDSNIQWFVAEIDSDEPGLRVEAE